MSADRLSREEIERIRDGYTATGFMDDDAAFALFQHALSEEVRLSAARAEGIEMAAKWHDDQAAELERRITSREGQFVSGMDRTARIHRDDAQMLRALLHGQGVANA